MAYRGRPYRPYALISLSANQTTNLAVNNHVEFDSITQVGDLISLSTGAGQADGIITLSAGWYYQIWFSLGSSSMTNAEVVWTWRNHPADTTVTGVTGLACTQTLIDSGTAADAINHGDGILTVDCLLVGMVIKADKASAAIGTQNNWASGSQVFIEALR